MNGAAAGVVTPGSTWDRMRAALASFHPGQRRVAEVLLAMSSEQLARASVSEVAELSGSSPATVVRTCQQLGYRGFRECAMLLALDARSAADVDDLDLVPIAPAASRFLRDAAAALLHAASTLDQELLGVAAADIAAARRLLVVGYGWSAGAVSTLAINLAALGRSVEAPTDSQAQVVAAASLAPGDVCLLVCYTGSHRHSQLVARVAAERGARVILVSTFSHSLTAAHCAVNVIFGGRETGDSRIDLPTAGVVQFAMLEAIRLAVADALGGTEPPGLTTSMRALVEGAVFDDGFA